MEFKNRTHFAEEGGLSETSGPKGCSDEQILNRLAANWTARAGHWFNRERATAVPTVPDNPDDGNPRI